MSVQHAVKSPLPADRRPRSRTLAGWSGELPRRASAVRAAGGHLAGVGALTALFAILYSVFDLVLYATFHDSNYDLVIFDQAVRSYAHFQPGISIIKGMHNGFGPDFSVLGDHFSPILATLAPLYWLYDGPQTLLLAQAVLFAIAIPPLWVFTRRAFGGGRSATIAAYLVCIAYGLSWPVASALFFDFHEAAFAPVLTAIALERIQAGRLRGALIALGALLLVKEDMGLLLAGIGIYLAVTRARSLPRQRLVAVILVAAGVGYTALATYVLIPAFGGRSDYYWAYTALGNNVPQAVGHIIVHPLSTLKLLFTPGVKLRTMGWLVGAFCFLPLLSPITLAAVPLIAERMLASQSWRWWLPHFHYNAFLVVVLVCGAVDGAARLQRWVTAVRRFAAAKKAKTAAAAAPAEPAAPLKPPALAEPSAPLQPPTPVAPATPASPTASGADRSARRPTLVQLGCAVAMCIAALVIVPSFPFGRALHAQFYMQTARSRAAAAADAVVPSGVVVEAANDVGPQLSSRDTVLMWDGEQPPLGAPWIVADVRHKEMTFKGGVPQQRARVAELLNEGYKIVFERHGLIVLHRGGQRASAPTQKAAS